jgi:hypothetical protein
LLQVERQVYDQVGERFCILVYDKVKTEP